MHPAAVSSQMLRLQHQSYLRSALIPRGSIWLSSSVAIVYSRDHKILALPFDGRVRDTADTESMFEGGSDAAFPDDPDTRRSAGLFI